MADVRSLLRAERQSRRITHPNASYSSDGKLLCNLCEVKVKTEAAWQAHLHSTQHTLRAGRVQDAASLRDSGANGSKKRKASDLATPPPEERKKVKSGVGDTESSAIDGGTGPGEPLGEPSLAGQLDLTNPVAEQEAQAIDLAALEEFERELQAMESSMLARNVLTSAPTISAAPMTAEQVAAQAREEQSAQRVGRDAEIEAERDDAARLLEDEFEQMESLEERVRTLRQRRDALRKSDPEGPRPLHDEPSQDAVPVHTSGQQTGGQDEDDEGGEDEDEDDDGEDVDEWTFGGR